MKYNQLNPTKNYIVGFYGKDENLDLCSVIGRAEIRLTEKSYYANLHNVVELIDKLYAYYWNTVSLPLSFGFKKSNETKCHLIMDNEETRWWFKVLNGYQAVTNKITYSPLTMWRLKVNIWVDLNEKIKNIKEIRS